MKQTFAEGLPQLKFVAQYSWNNQPTTLAVGIPQFPATGHDWYIGLQLTVPIFEGFTRTYQVRQAKAQVEVQRDAVREQQLKVGMDVWQSYQAMETATASLGDSETLLTVANQAFTVSEGRYEKGIGNILELLNAESSLASAKRQRIQALTDWRSSRLQLAAKLGRLKGWAMRY